MRKKRLALFLVLFFGMAFWLLGTPAAEAYKGQITVALTGEPTTMDPHVRTGNLNAIGWRMTYDALVQAETGTGKLIPWLATKWERLSPTKMKFWLRKGVKFSDGTPLTSEAVKFGMDRIFDPATKSVLKRFFRTYDRIEIVDDHTFIWHTKKSDNGLLSTLFFRPLVISPSMKGWDLAKMSTTPVGTGPYVLKSWTKGQKMVFEANPNWWGNSKYPNRPKTVIYRRIRESTTRVKALLKGEVDVIQGVKPQFMNEIKKDPNSEVVSSLSTRIMFVSFMSRTGGPFADLNVRMAVNHAIDVETIRNTFLPGLTKPIGQLFHPWSYSGYNPKKKWYPYDLAKAKAYLKKSGYSKGFKATLMSPSGRYPADKQTCEAVASMLTKINIQTKCRTLKWSLYRKTIRAHQKGKKKDPLMFYMGIGNPTGNPFLGGSNQTACKGSWSGHCFKDLDAAFDKANTTANPKAQQKEWEKVTDMIKAKATHKIFYNVSVSYAYRKTSVKFQPRHDEVFFAWEAEMKGGRN